MREAGKRASILRGISGLAALALGCALQSSAARAEVLDFDPETMIYVWPRWQKGFHLGAHAVGRFGAGTNLASPPGDLIPEFAYHAWINHIFEFHGSFGYGVANSTVLYGVGAKLNLIEFIEDPTSEMSMRGLQRGVLARVIKNFMIFAGADLMSFSFRDPVATKGEAWGPEGWKIVPSLGAQWYFYFPQEFAGRFYLETSVGMTKLGGSNYFAPLFAIGVELL